jgi:hypothetical protein
MAKMQDFWDLLREGEGAPVQPVEAASVALCEAKAEARSFATALRRGKMSLEQVCETIAISPREAAELAAFVEKYSSEEVLVSSSITFRRLVVQQLGKLLRGGGT